MIAQDTGEVVGGTFGFVEEKEVDGEEFVKVYLAGIKKFAELSKAGATLFELVYRELSGVLAKDRDTVSINLIGAQKWKPDLHKRTYERGMAELLDKGFLFHTVYADAYFVNINFMFNGDRLTLVQSYRLKDRKKRKAVAGQLALLPE